MAIILVTGQPGSGKTALTVDMLAHDDQFAGRPLFVMGVPDLSLDHSVCPAVADWTQLRTCVEDESRELAYFTFPENALVVIDEAQRIYRPRPVGSKVPPEVAAFETHRHLGIDFVLITQHAGLIDSNIRKLVGRHIHIRVTPLGRYRYEWTELGDPETASSRDIAAKTRYKLPQRAFSLYKSSQLHTKIKTRLPWFVWVFLIAALSTVVLAYVAYRNISSRMNPVVDKTLPTVQSSSHGEKPPVSNADYHKQSLPRVAGLHHTAPKYDELTKPVDAPWPVGCLISHQGKQQPSCRCIDQQGNRYATTLQICMDIVQNGIFKDWQGKESTPDRMESRQTPQAAGLTPSAVVTSAAPPLKPLALDSRPSGA